MLRKIQRWLWLRKFNRKRDKVLNSENYTRYQMEEAYRLGYNDGRRDGLAIAREQATNSLKEILWQTNQTAKPTKTPENLK